jgi:hypothetical protein
VLLRTNTIELVIAGKLRWNITMDAPDQDCHAPLPGGSGTSKILVADYRTTAYRGFVFARHDEYGLLLLNCTRKKSKGSHWQVPGGRVDEVDFQNAGTFIFVL